MSDYYKDELMRHAESWPMEGLEMHIKALESRIKDTKEHLRALKTIYHRRLRNKNLKDNGPRGGM